MVFRLIVAVMAAALCAGPTAPIRASLYGFAPAVAARTRAAQLGNAGIGVNTLVNAPILAIVDCAHLLSPQTPYDPGAEFFDELWGVLAADPTDYLKRAQTARSGLP